jgi:hypothetical protein
LPGRRIGFDLLAPVWLTSAATFSVIAKSISVAVRVKVPSLASSNTFAKIGMVLRRSTTLCTCANAFNKIDRSIVSFIVTLKLFRPPMARPAPTAVMTGVFAGGDGIASRNVGRNSL